MSSTDLLTTGTVPNSSSPNYIDLVGFGNTLGAHEGSGVAPTPGSLALLRLNSGCTDTDNNSSDFTTGSPNPRNTSTISVCPGVIVDDPPEVESTTPTGGATDVEIDATITINFREPVTVNGDWFDIDCNGSSIDATVTGSGQSRVLDPTTNFPHSETCTITISAANVEDTDDPADPMPEDHVWSFTTISDADVAPTITSTIPTADATDVAVDANITVHFSEPVNVTGTWFNLSCNSVNVTGTSASQSGGLTYIIDPDADLPNGSTCTVTIFAAQVKDNDGGLALPLPADSTWSFTTIAGPDDPPTVTAFSPLNHATDVPINTNISVTFSEAVSVNGSWFSIVCTTGGEFTATVTGGPLQYILDPAADFASADPCMVTIIGANVADQDSDPDAMTDDHSWTFTTATVDGDVPPSVVSTSPTNSESDVPVDTTITINFSEDVLTNGTWFTISCSISGNVLATASGGPQTFTLTSNTDFASSENCTVTIVATQVNDLDGGSDHKMSANYVWSFTTGSGNSDTPPEVSSHSPIADATDVAANANINVGFSEDVNATSDSFDITCILSGVHTFGITGGPQTFVLNPDMDFTNGEICTITVNAADIFDLDDTSTFMQEDVTWSFSTLDIPPTVISITPDDGAVDVPINTNIEVEFSENVAVNGSAFTINCTSGSVVFTLSGGGKSYILDPTTDLAYLETCTVTVVAALVSDTDAAPVYNLVADYVWSFTTVSDADGDTPPTVVSVSPLNGATDVPVESSITVSFSEDVLTSSGWYTVNCGEDISAIASSGPQNFTLDPVENLPFGATCQVTIHADKVKDLDGSTDNLMAADYVWNFSTRAATPADLPPEISTVSPTNGMIGVPVDTNITVTFNEDVAVSGTWYEIVCETSGSITAAFTGGPQTYTFNPNADFANAETCTVTILASQVIDQDDMPKNLPANYTWSFTTVPPVGVCEDSFTPIYTIQGTGAASPHEGGTIITQGVVTADFEDSLGGFYLQAETGDNDPLTSDGIFVHNPGADVVTVGHVIRVSGTVEETFEQTRLGEPLTIIPCGRIGTITATPVTLPFASASQPEQFEGMLVSFAQELTVTQNHNLGRFGEVTLSAGGRLFQPTNIAAPGAAANAQQASNDLNRIDLDDNSTAQNPDPTPYFDADATLRVGDTVSNLTGIINYSFGTYRVQPTVPPQFSATNPRTAAPADTGGTLRVASFNVLNYFNGPNFPTARGADTETEFQRQRAKIISAIVAINADIIGLIEIENDGYDESSSIQDLVNGLNDATAPGTYAFIAPDFPLGSDLIKVALLYRPGTVTPVGPPARTIDAPFNRRRPPLAQTFQENATNEVFTVVVNHFKAKICDNSSGNDTDLGDGQGCWNAERVQAAETLAAWLATDPTQSNDPDVLIIGDLNAYAAENPITTLQNAGYSNLIALYQGSHTYNFEGQSGYLDHALTSNTLTPQVAGLTIWHINADEPHVLDYNMEFKSAAQQALNAGTPYRSSDHDPVIIGLKLGGDGGFGSELKLLSPSGIIQNGYGNPLYTWMRLQDATEYQIYLAGTPTLSSPIFYDIVPDTGNCHANATCTLDLTTLSEAYRLRDGEYTVYMRAWLGNNPGGWAGPFTFTLDAPAPNAVTLQPVTNLDQSRPVFHWTLEDTAAYASWFRVYVAPVGDLAAPLIDNWFSRAELCGVQGTTCVLPSPVDMVNGTYGLYVQSWGPGGFSVGGIQNSGFAGMDFTISGTIPLKSSGLTTTKNQGRPTFMWTDDPRVSWYHVHMEDGGGEEVLHHWQQRVELCSAGVCALTPDIHPMNGSYEIYLQGWSPAGLGETLGPVRLMLDFLPPAPPTPLTVTNPISGQPTFTWQGAPGATWYQLWIGSGTGETHHTGWHSAADAGCAEPTVCAITPFIALPNDNYIWYVQAWGPGGFSQNALDGWAAGPPFVVAAPPTGRPTPNTPNSTTNKHNPVFTWAHVENTVYYNFRLERLENFSVVETLRDTWFSASSLGCASGTCTLYIPHLNLSNGDYAWSLRGYTPHSTGDWSNPQTFTVNR